MAGTRKTVEVTVLSGKDVAEAMLEAGFRLTDQERVIFDRNVAAGSEPVGAFEALLSDRVGPSARSLRDYPSVAAICGVTAEDAAEAVPVADAQLAGSGLVSSETARRINPLNDEES